MYLPYQNMILLVLCFSRDGATGCGVFCAVYNAIQQLQQDEEVDMFTIVRQLQSRRPEMISEMVYLNAFWFANCHRWKGSTIMLKTTSFNGFYFKIIINLKNFYLWKTAYLDIFDLSPFISCTLIVTLVIFANVFEELYIFRGIMNPFQTSFLMPYIINTLFNLRLK